MTELETDGGYTLLKDEINIVLTANRTAITCSTEQCAHATHEVISASATVNGDAVTMEGRNAIVPLSIVNERGYEVPATGDAPLDRYPGCLWSGNHCLFQEKRTGINRSNKTLIYIRRRHFAASVLNVSINRKGKRGLRKPHR